jgi:hypothetical protein
MGRAHPAAASLRDRAACKPTEPFKRRCLALLPWYVNYLNRSRHDGEAGEAVDTI